MKSWKKRWEAELDEKIPALREDVKNAEIPQVKRVVTQEKIGFFARLSASIRRKPWIASLSACACAVAVIFASVFLFNQPATPVYAEEGKVIAVEINPGAAFVLDDEKKISSVVSLNGDADVILNKEERRAEIEGKPVAEGVQIYVDYAAKLGYLDLSAESAVRISTEGEMESAEEVNQALCGYFQSKGAYIAVVTESLTEEKLSSRLGVKLEEVGKSLAETLDGWTELFSVRSAEGETTEGLQSLYKQIVPVDEAEAATVEGLLNENLDKISQNELDIKAIEALNDEIRKHEGNPGGSWLSYLLSDDYWDLQDQDRGTDEEFLALMAEMDEKLAAYEAAYGVRLENTEAMDKVLEGYNGFTAADLIELLSNLTSDLFNRWATTFTKLLEAVGVDTSHLALHDVPTDLGSYLEKTATYFQTRFDGLLTENEENYSAERAEVSAEAYENHIRSLVEKYGSLSAYWTALKK